VYWPAEEDLFDRDFEDKEHGEKEFDRINKIYKGAVTSVPVNLVNPVQFSLSVPNPQNPQNPRQKLPPFFTLSSLGETVPPFTVV